MPADSARPGSPAPVPPTENRTFHDATVPVGPGGEPHQRADADHEVMTTQQGCPVSDDQNSLKVGGPRGPVALEDFQLREKIFHFDHERIPERVVHARGYGVRGYFEATDSLADVTAAKLFSKAGKKTPVFARFSTVAGNKGSADVARDVRGFAVKFYTEEGNWDLVGNNIPVFFIQDAVKFPDLIHSVKPEPDRGFPQAQSAHDNFWDFASLTPESVHMLMWIMSDRAIPRSLRFMEGFGVHTFRFVTADGNSTFVKFHWKPKGGLQSVVWDEAVKINGADPDFHRRDLWNAIERGDFPEWDLGVQLFDDAFAERFTRDYGFDILDATKLIPEELVPIRRVGKLVLNERVDNFFAETEQVAFCTQNVVPGIDFSNDPLLQGRNFSYLDTQTKRLGGPNFTHIPVNAPRCPMHHFQQDGHMAMKNPVGRANYEPNSWDADKNPRECPEAGYRSFPAAESGPKVRARAETFADHYSQARQFYVSQSPTEQMHIADAFTFELSKVKTPAIRARVVSHLLNVDGDLARTVADQLGLKDLPAPADAARPTRTDLPASPALGLLNNGPETFAGRKVGALVTDGTDAGLLSALKAACEAEGAALELVAPHVGGITDSAGAHHAADEKVGGGPSVLYDAVALLPSSEGAATLKAMPPARDFVADAFAHQKFLAHVEAATPLLARAGVVPDDLDGGCVTLASAEDCEAFVKACRALRFWDRTA